MFQCRPARVTQELGQLSRRNSRFAYIGADPLTMARTHVIVSQHQDREEATVSEQEHPQFLAHFHSEEEVAKQLGHHGRTLARWRQEGIGPRFTQNGRRIIYHDEDVSGWLRAGGLKAAAASKQQPRRRKRRR